MKTDACPTEEQLYALLAEQGPRSRLDHVSACEACQEQLRRIEAESTILRHVGEPARNRNEGPATAGHPGAIGRFIVVGIWNDSPLFVTYRGLHAVVRRQVLIQVARAPLCESAAYQALLRANRGRWMQPRAHLAQVLDFGEFDSRPYLVLPFDDEVRLDRATRDGQLDGPTLLRIFGQVARRLADEKAPHPLFGLESVVLDEELQPMLVDLAATVLFGASADVSEPSSDKTPRLLAGALCDAVLRHDGDTASLSPRHSFESLTRALIARQIPVNVAETIAKSAAAESGAETSMAELATTLSQARTSVWTRLFNTRSSPP
jgi:hypothetical protein